MPDDERGSLRVLAFAASLRAESYNRRLAELAAVTVAGHGAEVYLATMREFDCPSYSQDVQRDDGFPEGAEQLRRRLLECDAFVICSPEYNASMPGVLKNVVDWVSRFSPQPFNERHGLVMSASPSMVGGNRGLWSLRIPLEHLGARIYPDMFSLAQAHLAFDSTGRIEDDELMRRFELTVVAFLDLAEAAKHYPCAKTAWYEHLGQFPDPAIDRVEAE